jgi:hypothetical protein
MARHATPLQHDLAFATDIGQGLLEEVRKLQALLAQRDHKINETENARMLATQEGEKLKQKLADLTKSLESHKRPISPKLQWICGGNAHLECRGEIDRGSFRCVYEVYSLLNVSRLPFLIR